MKIGLAFDLKDDIEAGGDYPEDALEEYDSIKVVKAISHSLHSLGHRTVNLGGGRKFLVNILKTKVDFVFNIAEGRGNLRSREAQAPAVLEMLNVPYSGSDPLTLAVTLDKPLAKQIVTSAGVTTPPWLTVKSTQDIESLRGQSIPLPAFVKPAFEGSSKGIRLTSRMDTAGKALAAARALLRRYGQPVIIEKYIEGEEITVGITGNTPPSIVGIMRVLPKKKFKTFVYSLEIKRDWRKLVDYECPAQLERATLKRIKEFSIKAYRALGCRDCARIDFRVAANGMPYFLEANPLPGLNPDSGDLPIMSYKMGWDYRRLIRTILEAALARSSLCL
ncbi:MAG: D-alanine--D-alanine ligase [Dehalococcoidia bacterium]|nr:D-alanine--D-alanine ligase [Dehalococcoidia bacterium]